MNWGLRFPGVILASSTAYATDVIKVDCDLTTFHPTGIRFTGLTMKLLSLLLIHVIIVISLRSNQ